MIFFPLSLTNQSAKKLSNVGKRVYFSPFHLAKIFLNRQLEVPKYWNSISYLIIKREEPVQS